MKSGTKKSKKHVLAEVIGWIGTAAVVSAYALVSFNVISGNGFWYPFLNLIGAIGITGIALIKGVMQSVVLNVVWGIVALVALTRLLIMFMAGS